jgi:putative redox protein
MPVESSKLIQGFSFEIKVRDFLVTTDVTEDLGGINSAPDPHDYLQVALAACTAITLQMYARRKAIPLEYADVKIKITAEGSSNEILREIKLVGDLNEEQKQALLTIANKCPIHKFLSTGANISSRIVCD